MSLNIATAAEAAITLIEQGPALDAAVTALLSNQNFNNALNAAPALKAEFALVSAQWRTVEGLAVPVKDDKNIFSKISAISRFLGACGKLEATVAGAEANPAIVAEITANPVITAELAPLETTFGSLADLFQ